MAIHRMVSAGSLHKLGRGFYYTTDVNASMAFFMVINKYYKDTVVSGATCLYNYELSGYMPEQIDLDAASDSSYRLDTDIFSIHRTTKIAGITFGNFFGVKCKTYCLERAVFEVIRVDGGFGDLTREVVKNFSRKKRINFTTLRQYGELFGVKGKRLIDMITMASELLETF